MRIFCISDFDCRLGKVEKRALDHTGKMTAEAVMKKLQDSTTQSSSDIRRVFQRYDKDLDGKVSESEFRQVCNNPNFYHLLYGTV